MLINESELADDPPKETLEYVAETLRNNLPGNPKVEPGTLAVTVTYPDGSEI